MPLLSALIIQICVLLLLIDNLSNTAFLIATGLFQLSWLFSVPFQLGVIARADISGRFFPLTIAFQAAGFTLGPILAGTLMSEFGFIAVRLLAAAGMMTGVLLVVVVALRYRNSPNS